MMNVVEIKSYALKMVGIKCLDDLKENKFIHKYGLEKSIVLNHTETIL
jgi:hypothetical protein